MPNGKIKKLVYDKGFGFIQPEEGADVFFHCSVVGESEFENLTEGQSVQYAVEENAGQNRGKGPRAISVTPV